MRLFYSPTSPFARKVRVLISEKQMTGIELVAASPFDAPEDLTGANPLSKVPALVRGNAPALFDSPVICEFLDDLGGGDRLLPEHGEARWDALRRQALADGMMETTLALALEINKRPEHERSPDWIAHWCRTIVRSVDALEAEVGEWGSAFDLGHITTGCALSYLDFRASDHVDWRKDRPALAAWHEQVAARPSFAVTRVPD
ncbi:MAG: glutathione S-transferase N-terminal domain-containing protein [Altererythrobacter sp.]